MSAKRKVALTPLDWARGDLEQAFADIRLATDSNGVRIKIEPTSTDASAIREKLEEFLRFMHGSRFIGENAELAYARNLQLLVTAWIAALKFEAEVKKS